MTMTDTTSTSLEGFDPASTVAKFFGVHIKTLGRWKKRPGLNFPKPIIINGREYWRRDEYQREFVMRAALERAATPPRRPAA
jgi:hypothetical protein